MNTVNYQYMNIKKFINEPPHLLDTNLPEPKMDLPTTKYSVMAKSFLPINKIHQKTKTNPQEGCNHSELWGNSHYCKSCEACIFNGVPNHREKKFANSLFRSDPQMVFNIMLQKQHLGRTFNSPNCNYQPHRMKLIGWIISICNMGKFESETIHLSVNLLDNFLAGKI